MGRVVEAAYSLIPLPSLRLRVGEPKGVVLREVGNLRYFLGYTLLLFLLTEVSEI